MLISISSRLIQSIYKICIYINNINNNRDASQPDVFEVDMSYAAIFKRQP